MAALAADHRRAGGVPSVADSVAAFNLHVRPLERAQRTRSKYVTHRLSILTWGIWKGCFARLLPMSDDMVRAYVWDCLAFEASHSVLKHALDAIKAWHQRLGVRVPLDGHGDYRRITHSLGRFQPTPRIIKISHSRGSCQAPSDPTAARTPEVRGRPPPDATGTLDALPHLLAVPSLLVRLPGRSHGHPHLLPLHGAGFAADLRHLVGL